MNFSWLQTTTQLIRMVASARINTERSGYYPRLVHSLNVAALDGLSIQIEHRYRVNHSLTEREDSRTDATLKIRWHTASPPSRATRLRPATRWILT
jgi:hypothetical protein